MTNAELNLAIAKLVYPHEDFCKTSSNGAWGVWVDVEMPHPATGQLSRSRCFQPIKDYCNNWNDLMPLVVEHKINLITSNPEDGVYLWIADWWDEPVIQNISCKNENPQRALAECLLKVLEDKQ